MIDIIESEPATLRVIKVQSICLSESVPAHSAQTPLTSVARPFIS